MMTNEQGKKYLQHECPLCNSGKISRLKTVDKSIGWCCKVCLARWTEHLEFIQVDVCGQYFANSRVLMIYKERPKKKTINIIVEGGVIQSVDDIPKGVEVKVKDFDVEGFELGKCIESIESPGNYYFESLWGDLK